MSTKIYNGYRLPLWGLKKLQEFSREFQRKIREKGAELYNKDLVELAVEAIDVHALTGEYPKWSKGRIRSPIGMAWDFMLERTKEHDSNLYKYTCEIIFIPVGKKLLAMYYGAKDEYQTIWESMEGVESYPYWDNTDKPDDVSSKEWKAREKDWDKALDEAPASTPIVAGFQLTCFGLYDGPHPDTEGYQNYLPSFEKRVRARAENELWKDFLAAAPKIEGEKEPSPMDLYMDFRDWVKEDAGKEAFKQKKEQVAAKLKKELTHEDLTQEVEEEE